MPATSILTDELVRDVMAVGQVDVIVSAATPDGYASMIGRTLTVSRMGEAQACEVEDEEDYRRVLRDTFGLDLTADEVAGLGLF